MSRIQKRIDLKLILRTHVFADEGLYRRLKLSYSEHKRLNFQLVECALKKRNIGAEAIKFKWTLRINVEFVSHWPDIVVAFRNVVSVWVDEFSWCFEIQKSISYLFQAGKATRQVAMFDIYAFNFIICFCILYNFQQIQYAEVAWPTIWEKFLKWIFGSTFT